jgi:transposase
VIASERNEATRADYRATVMRQDGAQFVFVDESGTQTNLTRVYGWAPHDQRATEAVPRRRGKNTTLIAALTWTGLQAPWTLEGAMDRRAFDVYIIHVLVPTLQPGQIVVLDNLNVHKSPVARAAIEAAGCRVQFLPTYSPDLNPIEHLFSKIKAILRRLKGRTRAALLDALAVASTTITPADARGWILHAGYRLLPLPS